MIAARGYFVLLFSLFFISFAQPVHAQLGIPNMENSIFLSTSPVHPKPGDTVQVYAQSVFQDLVKGTDTWTINGKVVAQGAGVTNATFVAGTLGSKNSIVFDTTSDANTASTGMTLIPTEVDLLFESDSYVPPFYGGRALPTEGTSVRLVAMPRFLRSDGSFVPASSLIFTWTRNGSVVSVVSGKGKSAVVLPSPVLFGTDTVTVDVTTDDGTMSGTATLHIPATKPLLLFYEDHPLFGVTYYRALGAETFVPESEATFVAVPYFTNVNSPNDTSLTYDWTVNNQSVPADNVNRSAITITSAGQKSGFAQIHVDLSQPQNPFFSAQGEWGISFSELQSSKNAGSDANNPFMPQ